MSIIAKREPFEIPSEGQFAAICCDVIDLGKVDETWQGHTKKKHKIVVRFILNARNSKGHPFWVSQRFTLTMDDRGRLRPFLENWRGKKYTDEQADDGIDIEKMLEFPALIQIVHNGQYANIGTIMRLPDGMEPPPIGDYVRVKDRPTEDEDTTEETTDGPEPATDDDDDLPF